MVPYFPAGDAVDIVGTTPIIYYPWDLFFNQATLDRHFFKETGASLAEMDRYDKSRARGKSEAKAKPKPAPTGQVTGANE